MPETYTLVVDQANAKAFKVLIAAEFCGVSIDVPSFDEGKIDLKKSPLGHVPYLETSKGVLFESFAIARFVGGQNRAAKLFGGVNGEKAFVESWIGFCLNELELPATIACSPVLGAGLEDAPGAVAQAKADLADRLAVLETQLKASKAGWLVGSNLTLADICVVCTLLYPFKFVCDASFLKPYPTVTKWFRTCVALPQFKAVVGNVAMCGEEPAAAPAGGADKGKGKGKDKGKGDKGANKKEEGKKGANDSSTNADEKNKEKEDGATSAPAATTAQPAAADQVRTVRTTKSIEMADAEAAACCTIA
jgi:elongation factor 1-gamma